MFALSCHRPSHRRRLAAAALALVLPVAALSANAFERHGGAFEPQRAPHGYQRMEPPRGVELRPHQFDRGYFAHNFQARRGYRIGPWRAPPGFVYRRWSYGEFLPRAYWGPEFVLADFWLFGLDIPPVGYEWVRYGPDALLIDLRSGEVVQTVYDNFL
ncbi:RcnB family protein [Lysobacter enzymogenes]|uniref:RcnB family protein n=1 Tax=Lysobacter enzymogenes TaxID=69 RepID=UPI001A95B895|nr:RcnB family protein [Lysobacter enzymogenes]QQP95484.1 RcnB family protein [Lysobacter enzymogenes]